MVFGVFRYVLIVFAGFLVASLPACLAQEGVLGEIESMMKDLEYLHSRGVDVERVVDLLNKAISEYVSGDVTAARTYLEEAKKVVESLKIEAEPTHARIIAVKTVIVACLVSIPLMIYFILPRLYLYLWFRFRKKWVVRW